MMLHLLAASQVSGLGSLRHSPRHDRESSTPTPPVVGPDPPNLQALECAFNQLALEFGTARIAPSSVPALRDALNIGQLCGPAIFGDSESSVHEQLAAASIEFGTTAAATAASLPLRPLAAATFYVAVDGSDSNAGTLAAPFKTVTRARDAMRATQCASGGCVTLLRGGVYDLSMGALQLNASDSYTSYASYPGERAVLSGAKSLAGVTWTPVNGGPILVANVAPLLRGADPRFESWLRGEASPDVAAPPTTINSLFVNGIRQVRARYPNGNPHDGSGICFSASQRPGEGCSPAHGYSNCINGDGGAHQQAPGAVAHISGITPNRGSSPTLGCPQCTTYGTFAYAIFPPPANHPVYNQPLPGHGWTNNSHFTFWGSLFDRSAAAVLTTNCDAHWARALNWTQTDQGVLQTFHHQLWGGWAYALGNGTTRNGNSVTVPISYGGYQEARGGYLSNGQHFYIENILEELDAPGEWYYDSRNSLVYAYPNMTSQEWAAAAVSVSTQASVVRIVGAPGAPVINVTLDSLDITGTSTTFLEIYEVPSGGDWSIHRGGAVFVQDAERLQVTGCTFNATGGNGLFLSNHVTDSTVAGNEFVYTGDSAIALLGAAVLADGSAPTYPNHVTIARNLMHETGIFGKQSSCIAMSITANLTLIDNVCFNGPRAGINHNDGFGGGTLMRGNLVFNTVRETVSKALE